MDGEAATKPGHGDVDAFLAKVAPARRQRDARSVLALMSEATGHPPVMWGASIVGFGHRHMTYASGREVDWMEVGFSPRKAATTLYLAGAWDDMADQLQRLGPHSTGAGCLYIKDVEAVDPAALRELVEDSVARARRPD